VKITVWSLTMHKEQEGQWVVPNPQLPRSFGLMNIVFGFLLLLFGAGMAVLSIYGPAFVRGFTERVQADMAAKKAQHDARIADLEKKVKEAKTEDEKRSLEGDLQMLQTSRQPNLALATDAMKVNEDPRIKAYTYSELASGILLNVLMIISGVGLLFLAEWARRMAIVVAWLKILRWTAMLFLTIFIILPITMEKMQPLYKSIQVQAAGKSGGGGNSLVVGFMQMSAVMSAVTMVAEVLIACIYPVFVIWFMTRPPARAACLAAMSRRDSRVGREPARP